MPTQSTLTSINRNRLTLPPRLWVGKITPRAAGRATLTLRLAALAFLLAIAAGGMLGAPGPAEAATDYDRDNDNLIDIRELPQLNAIRWDLNGNGARDSTSVADWEQYQAAFPNPRPGMGCPDTCAGYELQASLDFDTNGNGFTHTNGSGDPEDDYYRDGRGWDPIGTYSATFHGNGHTIDNLFYWNNSTYSSNHGLFRQLSGSGDIIALGVRNAYLNYDDQVDKLEPTNAGILAGQSNGDIIACYTTGYVRGYDVVGSLVGSLAGSGAVRASYSTASVSASGFGGQGDRAGGLVGIAYGGAVTGSYYAGASVVAGDRGALAGRKNDEATISADTYWDTETIGLSNGVGQGAASGAGKTTAELQAPTDYTGIYETWDDYDLDGDGRPDDPWDFGDDSQYPVLKYAGQNIYKQGRPEPDPEPEPEEYVAPPIVYNLNIRFSVKGLTLDEGESATYQVRMSQSPVGHPAKVRIHSNNPDVIVAPTELTFSSADFRQWQTVKVSTLRDPNDTDESAHIAHRGPNLSYGSIIVTVNDTWPGTVTATVNGRTVAVRHTYDAPYGVTVTAPDTLDTDTQIRIAGPPPSTPDGVPGYGLGQSAAARTLADIRVQGTPADGLDICLPVSPALLAEAGDHPLTLLRYADDSWAPVAGATQRESVDGTGTTMLCAAGITEYGVFAVAYRLPALGAVSNLAATLGEVPGSVALTWTPGANAAVHWIAGINRADPHNLVIWEPADNPGSRSFRGLASGATYIFTIAAGRGEGDARQWSAWAPWATITLPAPTPTPTPTPKPTFNPPPLPL